MTTASPPPADQSLPTADDLAWAVGWIDRLEGCADQERWRGGHELRPGVFQWPWCELPEPVEEFVQGLYDRQILRRGYDPQVLARWNEDPSRLERMSLLECLDALTAFVRGDRFCEGFLASALNDGRLVAVLRRLAVLHLPDPPAVPR